MVLENTPPWEGEDIIRCHFGGNITEKKKGEIRVSLK
jgi:hypothetical protein